LGELLRKKNVRTDVENRKGPCLKGAILQIFQKGGLRVNGPANTSNFFEEWRENDWVDSQRTGGKKKEPLVDKENGQTKIGLQSARAQEGKTQAAFDQRLVKTQ